MICEQCNKEVKTIFALTLVKKTGRLKAVKVSACKKCLELNDVHWIKFFIDELTNPDERKRKLFCSKLKDVECFCGKHLERGKI